MACQKHKKGSFSKAAGQSEGENQMQ